MKKIKILLLIIVCIMLFSTAVYGSDLVIKDETNLQKEINLNEYPRDSRERFVASLAIEKNISYEEADALEKETASEIIITRSPVEILKYKTVDKHAGTISGDYYNQVVYIATEVRYVWNQYSNELVYIESLGSPLMYLPGVTSSSLSMQGGDFNIEKYNTSGRISRTVSFTYTVEGITISIGGDILGVSTTTDGTRITTRAKTYDINITESDL
ncbi:MAG: hypothetical protein H0S78_02230 [Tissierellales bacterium]|nr:hypothetical protein [Tissierellales bacterium]